MQIEYNPLVCLFVCLFACLCVCLAVCLVVSLFVYSVGWLFLCFGSFGPHFGVLVALCGSFWCLFCTLGDLGAPFGHPWTPYGHPWAPFGHPWGPFSGLFHTLGRGPGPLGPLLAKGSKKVPKIMEKGTQNDRKGYPQSTYSL